MRKLMLIIMVVLLTVACSGTQTDTAEPESTETTTESSEQAPQESPNMTENQGTVTVSVDFGPNAEGGAIRLITEIEGDRQTHEIGQDPGGCVVPAWTEHEIDPEGQAAGAILSFRCRGSSSGSPRETIYRVIPHAGGIEVQHASRATEARPEGPVGVGELNFETLTQIQVPMDTDIVVSPDML